MTCYSSLARLACTVPAQYTLVPTKAGTNESHLSELNITILVKNQECVTLYFKNSPFVIMYTNDIFLVLQIII